MGSMFEVPTLGVTISKYPLLTSVVVLLIAASTITYLLNRQKSLESLNLPVVGDPDSPFFQEQVLERAAKYPDAPFVVPFAIPVVVLPHKLHDEIRAIPGEDIISFRKDVNQTFQSQHTGIGKQFPGGVPAVKIELNRHLASSLDDLQDEMNYAFDTQFGQCEDWEPIVFYKAMSRIVALISGRVFVGRPLSRNEEWIESTVDYTYHVNQASYAIQKWSLVTRGIVAPFLSEVKKVKQYTATMAKLIDPVLKATVGKAYEEEESPDSTAKQGRFMSWVLKHTPKELWGDSKSMAGAQMGISFASIHTTTMATSQVMYDLISRREYIQPLIDEIKQVISEDGQDVDSEGNLKLKKTSMAKFKKLDSFLKESQRLSPPGITSTNRLVTGPLKLSTGITIPAGTRIAFLSLAIHTSTATPSYSPSYNPETNKPPTEFDGFRFYNLRSMEGKEHKHQFVTASNDSLIWGHGRYACPGRFFASNEMKMILIEILLNWEFRAQGDVEMKGGLERRPKSAHHGFAVVPSQDAVIEFKRRKL